MPLYFYAFFYAVLSMFLFIPFAKQIGFRFGIIDKVADPEETDPEGSGEKRQKIHKKPTPRTGGIAIFISFWTAIILSVGLSRQVFGIFLGSLFIFVLMLIDDKVSLKPGIKLMGQLIASTIPIFFGVRINFVTNPISGQYLAIGWIGIPFTMIWCVAFMNALNLIDGLDGLAGGIAGIASLGIVMVSLMKGGLTIATVFGMALVGVCLIFLRYNFHPASIFLGDSGANFLGYMIAMISTWGGLKTSTSVILIITFLAIGVPFFDIFFSIITRLRKKKKVYEADLENIHYQLHKRGWGQRRIAFLFYSITLLLCAIPIFLWIR
jgi:UDP-GlcNAc:undecaprenyl-phosphate GlcNAc-1-phosphate transferase